MSTENKIFEGVRVGLLGGGGGGGGARARPPPPPPEGHIHTNARTHARTHTSTQQVVNITEFFLPDLRTKYYFCPIPYT